MKELIKRALKNLGYEVHKINLNDSQKVEDHSVQLRDKTYHVKSYGGMSYRQYFDAREDYFIDEVIKNGFESLGYIGASYGLQSMVLSNYGEVVAFEPVEVIFKAMIKNFEENNISNIHSYKIGLGPQNEIISVIHNGHTGATPSVSNLSGQIKEDLHIVDFNSPIFRIFDSLVIDIEGFEFDAIVKGPSIPQNIKKIYLEAHHNFYEEEDSFERILNEMKGQGFEVQQIGNRNKQEHMMFKR